MTSTRCERHGQVELGVIEHEGREFVALGASVIGSHITAYTQQDSNRIHLMTWCGKTMLDSRSEIVERYWGGTTALMFRLPRGRFIVGYALGENGMLFRGELIEGTTDDDARLYTRSLADHFAELDAEDEEAFQAELVTN